MTQIRKRKKVKRSKVDKSAVRLNNDSTYILILIGGIFVLIGGVFTSIFGNLMMFHMRPILGIFAYMGVIIGVISGIIMIISAVKLNNRRSDRSTWAVIALVFTVLSLLDMGGFGIGFLLGIIGSLIELTRKG